MLAKADRRIYLTAWCTFLLCLVPGWGLFHVATTIREDIQLDEGHLKTSCEVRKFTRFEPCCTKQATVSKMTIIPGDGFQEGEYQSCVPDGYYTHCFVMADGCDDTHLSPKYFDEPPCLPHDTKVGDTFQCYASCQAKNFTLATEEPNYHGLMFLFFGCAFAMLLITFSGSYMVIHWSNENEGVRGDTLNTPLQTHRSIRSWMTNRSSLFSSDSSQYYRSRDADELTDVQPPNAMRESGGSLLSYVPGRIWSDDIKSEHSIGGGSFKVSELSYGGENLGENTTNSGSIIGGSRIATSDGGCSTSSNSTERPSSKKDPTRKRRRRIRFDLTPNTRRSVRWADEPVYITPETPSKYRTRPLYNSKRRYEGSRMGSSSLESRSGSIDALRRKGNNIPPPPVYPPPANNSRSPSIIKSVRANRSSIYILRPGPPKLVSAGQVNILLGPNGRRASKV